MDIGWNLLRNRRNFPSFRSLSTLISRGTVTMLRLDSTGVHDSHDTSYSCSEAEDPAQEEAGVMLEVAIPDGRMEAAYSDTENMKVSRSLVR